MATRKNNAFRTLWINKGDDLKTIYAKVRRSFTAADLQKFTEIEEMEPAEAVLADLKRIHREEMQKRRKKKK